VTQEVARVADEVTTDSDGCIRGLIGAITSLDKQFAQAKEPGSQRVEGSMTMAARSPSRI